MQLSIRKTNLQWSDALAGYAERRIHHGLDRIGDCVRSVLVRLADINGPRGGQDKHCLVAVRLATGHKIMANGLDRCPYRAIDGAVNRLKRSITERKKRQRDRRKRDRHHPRSMRAAA